MYFTGVPAHLYHKGFLPGGWLGSPLAFPMLFLRFYFLPGAMIPELRFAVICRLAMRVIECVYFTGVSAHLHYKGFLPGGWLGSPLAFPILFLCFPKVLFASRRNDT